MKNLTLAALCAVLFLGIQYATIRGAIDFSYEVGSVNEANMRDKCIEMLSNDADSWDWGNAKGNVAAVDDCVQEAYGAPLESDWWEIKETLDETALRVWARLPGYWIDQLILAAKGY